MEFVVPYSGQPQDNTADELRFLIGDTDSDKPLLLDEEVAYLLAKYPVIECAAYHGALRVRARYASKARKSIGSATIEYTTIVDGLDSVIGQLKEVCGTSGARKVGLPTAGGIDTRPKIAGADFDNPSAVDP